MSDLLEPCEAKVSSTVLRGTAGGDTRGLPGGAGETQARSARERTDFLSLVLRACVVRTTTSQSVTRFPHPLNLAAFSSIWQSDALLALGRPIGRRRWVVQEVNS